MEDMSINKNKTKVLVILGPTASGKSDLAVELAKKYNGEVISADSRQVYKGLNIGTDKITKTEMRGIPHHMLDVVSTKVRFTVADFVRRGQEIIADISSQGKLPIVVGGTMLYIDALFSKVHVPRVPPNQKLRDKLQQRSAESLLAELIVKDSRRAKMLTQEGQSQNKRRLIRALEIINTLGSVPKADDTNTKSSPYDILWLGLQNDSKTQKEKINKRNAEMLNQDSKSKQHGGASLLDEVKWLIDKGVTQKQFDTFGFEYKYPAMYLFGTPIIKDNQPTLDDVLLKMNSSTWRYAKKQRAWWAGRDEINWFGADEYGKLRAKVREFIY